MSDLRHVHFKVSPEEFEQIERYAAKEFPGETRRVSAFIRLMVREGIIRRQAAARAAAERKARAKRV